MYRILVTGSRNWWSKETIWDALAAAYNNRPDDAEAVVVHGACLSGADSIASGWARAHKVKVERHPADWKTYGRAAGPIRNRKMVNLGADICLAFIRDNSKGASGTASMAESAGIPTLRFLD